MAILEMRDVTLRFGEGRSGGDAGPATIERVSLELGDNEFLTVLGPSGCGKTTLLRIVAGFEKATSGRVLFDGSEVKAPGSERVMVFQQPWLYPWLSVRKNVAFGLELQGGRVDWKRVDEMIDVVGLSGFSSYPPYRLSGGMQQRAALARALVMSPKILLMDEPFGALDAQTRQDLQEFLLSLWERLQVAVMFITHDVEEAILLGDRMLVMGTRPGCIALELPIELPRPRTEQMMLEPAFLEIRRQALDTLREVALRAAGITGTGAGDLPGVPADGIGGGGAPETGQAQQNSTGQNSTGQNSTGQKSTGQGVNEDVRLPGAAGQATEPVAGSPRGA
ncbi:MAG: ABC transporter ATP-binding protein [Acidimicrobiales bacterium]|jgi:NitT/TauT family transport system ATP-binding protein|nr:ABC transporter ATP-binding protein [Actinomycetota bacterium]